MPPVLDNDGQVRSSEDQLITFIDSFISVLVHVPWHPEHGAFFLTKGLIKVVKDYPWEKGSAGRSRVFLALLPLYASFYQQHLSFQRGESHDVLYGGDSDFQDELFANIDKLVDDLIADINALKDDIDPTTQKKGGRMALDYINVTAAYAQINAKQAATIASMMQVAKRQLNVGADLQYLNNTTAWLKSIPELAKHF